MFLVIAEKPSVALSIGSALGGTKKADGYAKGDDFVVSWCYGHLAEYVMPEKYHAEWKKWTLDTLPMFPEKWKLAVSSGKNNQVKVLKSLLTNAEFSFDYVVNACDAGREGELIFKRIYDISKSKLPVKRLWISSMEEQSIRDGFSNLKDGEEYHNLGEAAETRAQADWLVGINSTRAFTCAYNTKYSVGRVQSPTVELIYERDKQIKDFVKEQYFHTHILDKSGLDAISPKFDDRSEADDLAALCKGKAAVVKDLEKKEKALNPPKLYDLTALQRDANSMYGLKASETLEAAQSLYEKKYITYPRTDARYLTSDMTETVKQVFKAVVGGMQAVIPFPCYADHFASINALLNDAKVSDHHAIIPTVTAAGVDYNSLSAAEQKVFSLICTRLFEATGTAHRYQSFKASIECENNIFTATGKVITDNGWKDISKLLKVKKEDEEEDVTCDLSSLKKGDTFYNVDTKVTEHWTKPPAHYTEATLLAAMEKAGAKEMDDDVERKGLGTTATRAGIIDKIISTGYVARDKKSLLITEKGIALCEVLPEYFKSPQMTADWENRLLQIERGKEDADSFNKDIREFTKNIVNDCRNVTAEQKQRYGNMDSFSKEKKELGKCPWCGSPVYTGKSNFYCSNKECKFAIWKNDKFLTGQKMTVTEAFVKEMLKDGKSLRTLTSKKGNKYKAYISFDHSKKDKGWVNYSLDFYNEKK